MATESFPDFVEAMRQRKVVVIRTHTTPELVHASPIPGEFRDYNWAIPSFEFGRAFDPNDPTFIGHDPIKRLWADVDFRDLHLPFPECIFLFRYRASIQNHVETVNLVHLWQESDGTIIGNTFFKQDLSGDAKRWAKVPFQFAILPSAEIETNLDDGVELSPTMEREYLLDARAKYQECVNAISLLKTNRAIVTTDILTPRFEQVNRGRAATGKLKPLPATRQIHFDRAKFVSAYPVSPTEPGSTKRPHERRGHYRKMRSGAEVWVRSSKINGGAEQQPAYVVAP